MSEPREKIRLPDGRFVECQGLAHNVALVVEII